jgi:hypothetical protein
LISIFWSFFHILFLLQQSRTRWIMKEKRKIPKKRPSAQCPRLSFSFVIGFLFVLLYK